MNPRLLIASALVLVFAAGAAADMTMRRIRDARAHRAEPASWAEVARSLNLSAQQQQRIDSIFAAYQPKTDALLRDLAPRLQALADSIDAELLPVLDAAQRAALARARAHPRLFLIRRKTSDGERVDTIRVQPRSGPR